ncbi:hypothetical protein [Actinoplanes sp. HUAS TT8]|uniref:hypothetical protein n=1 Tax=Actinoplanes sp. HUAS TT8 TaxID=3447453 RepID=UPI003F51FD48
MSGSGWRIAALAGIVAVAVAGSLTYVVHVRSDQKSAAAAPGPSFATADLAAMRAVPHVVFRSTIRGAGFGKVALAALTDPAGPRALTPATCDRVYATADRSLCLYARPGLVTTYHADVLGPDWKASLDLPLSGIPSRARLSRDGSLGATTTFVYGDSYAAPGQFSTRTLVSRTDGSGSEDLEKFTLVVDGRPITAADRNLWGVTFADDDTFYATAASGKKTWLVQGSLSARTLTALREDAECPSLSPDRTRVAIKTRGDLPAGQWRISVFDLRTRQTVRLAETHSVDDQVEWLDDQHVLYGLARQQTGTSSTDVWTANADGSGTPAIFIPDAWSPAVVR